MCLAVDGAGKAKRHPRRPGHLQRDWRQQWQAQSNGEAGQPGIRKCLDDTGVADPSTGPDWFLRDGPNSRHPALTRNA